MCLVCRVNVFYVILYSGMFLRYDGRSNSHDSSNHSKVSFIIWFLAIFTTVNSLEELKRLIIQQTYNIVFQHNFICFADTLTSSTLLSQRRLVPPVTLSLQSEAVSKRCNNILVFGKSEPPGQRTPKVGVLLFFGLH